jgi:hypothetical protein
MAVDEMSLGFEDDDRRVHHLPCDSDLTFGLAVHKLKRISVYDEDELICSVGSSPFISLAELKFSEMEFVRLHVAFNKVVYFVREDLQKVRIVKKY